MHVDSSESDQIMGTWKIFPEFCIEIIDSWPLF